MLDDGTRRALTVPADILALDEARMRQLGYWVVDRVIEHLTGLGDQRAISEASPAALAALLGGPLPRDPGSIDQDLERLADIALANQQHGDHPRYFARVPGPSSYPAILGEWLATGMQSVASSWGGGSGPTSVELIASAWLRDAIGLASTCDGVMLSGGSMANTTAAITARHLRGDGIVYLSDQTHSSIKRGLLAMGQPEHDLRTITSDADYRMPASAVRAAIQADVAVGRRPMMVIATAGTTNTGAVDDLEAIADICEEFGVWFHVDGAYGGPAALCERGRAAMPGLERADSFVVDPHKWLFQPYDIACLFVKQPGALEQTFAMYPEYLADVTGGEVNMHNRSLELTRRGRALKLWLTLRTYGLDTLGQAIDRGIGLAEYAQQVIEADSRLEVITPAQLGIVTFAGLGAADDRHSLAAARLTADGYAAATSTVLSGRTVLRLCTINPQTTTDDIDGTVNRLAEYLFSD
jgi:aromatic-L-amino-acid decarboxylase